MRSRIGNAVLCLSMFAAGGLLGIGAYTDQDMPVALLLAAIIVGTGLSLGYVIADIEV